MNPCNFKGYGCRMKVSADMVSDTLGKKSSDEVFVVKLGGLVHDLGKIWISDAILLKPDKLTDEEYATMQEHPRIGMELLSNHPLYPVVMPSVIEHHVRADGKGYPKQM